jgi:hypothetical protein
LQDLGFSKPTKYRAEIPTNFFESRRKKNKLQQILSPNAEDEGV